MSQLQVNRINDASGGVLAPISSVMRNRIINGAMVIDQRNAGASVTPSTSIPTYIVDRFIAYQDAASKFSVQQDAGAVTPPAGFNDYLGATSLSAYTVTSGQLFILQQQIEGYNVADLNWGTANAKTVTLSFWVRSSLTGTFGGSLRNSAGNRSYPYSYTITSANTWEQKSITITGDTTGTWLVTNGIGISCSWGLGVGSTFSGTAGAWAAGNFFAPTGATSVVGTNGATFYITGVQLEVGTQATSFEYRQYQQELALAQRYFHKVTANTGNNYMGIGTGVNTGTSTADIICPLPVTMRATPSASFTGDIYCYDGFTAPLLSSISAVYGGFYSIYIGVAHAGGSSAGRGIAFYTRNTAASSFSFSAEL